MFSEGEDVLWRGPDGLLYLGVLVEIEDEDHLVRFGDGSEKKAKVGDLRRLGNIPNEVPRSAPPTPPPPILTPYDGMDVPFHVLQARKELPYDFENLIWDSNHERNIEEKYCYCGESGVWYKKMLQCQKCQQWFHQECIRNPNVSQLLFGDRFYEFVCTLCLGTSEEIVKRLDIGWVDSLHLILFHLMVYHRKEHHDLETAIIPLLKKKLKLLQSPSSVLKSSRIEPNYLENLLKANKSRFKCGSKSKSSGEKEKKRKFWTLVKLGPPLAPHNKIYQKDSSVIDVNFKSKQNNHHQINQKNSSNNLTNNFNLQQRRPALKTAENGKKGVVMLKITKKCFTKPLPKDPPLENWTTSLVENNGNGSGGSSSADCYSNSHSDGGGGGSGSGSSAWSFGSLDTFIPRPKNFLGPNNPFRTEVISSDSSSHHHVSEFGNSFMRPPILHHQHQQSSKRKRKWSPGPLGSAGSSPHSSISSLSSSESVANLPLLNNNKFDAIEDDTIEWKTSIVDPVKQLKWSINSYFEADHRIARGEKIPSHR